MNIHVSKFNDQTIRNESFYDLHIISLYEK
jgi:hypothetical protein